MADPFSRREHYLSVARERAEAEHRAANRARSSATRTRLLRNLAGAVVVASALAALLGRATPGILLASAIAAAAAIAGVIVATRSYREAARIVEAHLRAAGAFDRLRRSALLVILDPGMDEQDQRRAQAELDEIGVALDGPRTPD